MIQVMESDKIISINTSGKVSKAKPNFGSRSRTITPLCAQCNKVTRLCSPGRNLQSKRTFKSN